MEEHSHNSPARYADNLMVQRTHGQQDSCTGCSMQRLTTKLLTCLEGHAGESPGHFGQPLIYAWQVLPVDIHSVCKACCPKCCKALVKLFPTRAEVLI